VATITEIYDYLRVLFARVGRPHCPKCKREIQKLTNEEMVDVVLSSLRAKRSNPSEIASVVSLPRNDKMGSVKILAPVVLGRKGEYYQLLYDLYNSGFARVRIDGQLFDLSQQIKLKKYQQHTIEVVVDSVPVAGLAGEDDERWQGGG
jgi:excinuclease ABC subunit A